MKLQFMSRVKDSKFANELHKILCSPFFVMGLSLFTLLCSSFKVKVLGFIVLTIIFSIVCITQRDLKPIIPLVIFTNCIGYYKMSLDLATIHYVILGICAFVAVLAIAYYFIFKFVVEKEKFNKGKLFWGLVVLFVVCMFSGIACKDYNHVYTLRLFGVFVLIFLGYLLLANSIDESAKDYTAFTFVCFGIFACLQMVVFYAGTEDVVLAFHQKALTTWWGMTNSIATAIAMSLPFAVYLATKKAPQIYIPLSVVMLVGIFFTFSRGNMLFVAIFYPLILIYGFIVSKKKLSYGITSLVCLVLVSVVIFALKEQILEWFGVVRSLGLDDNGRKELWDYALNDFKNNKIFGAGFYGEDGIDLPTPLKKFHSTVLQILASAGIVGCIGFIVHYFQRYKMMFTKLSVFKVFALFGLALYEAYGLIDINLLRYFQIILLVIILVTCEKETEKTREPAFANVFKGGKKMNTQNFSGSENLEANKTDSQAGSQNKSKDMLLAEENSNLGNNTSDSNLGNNPSDVESQNIIPKSVSETSQEVEQIVKQIETINAEPIPVNLEAQENQSDANVTAESNSDHNTNIQTQELSDKELTKKHKFYRYFLKRFFDITLSLIAMIILSPVYLIVSIMVRIKLGNPVIFKQLRPGYKNKIFMFYKYRSMLNATDKNGELLPDSERMTKFGKLLRKTSLDELPQLWNIFKGDMSFVGPRPKLVKDMVFYNETQNKRSLVRPGLTGYAQANGRNLNSWQETFDYDLYYVKNCSLWLDIKILFTTALKVIKKEEILTQDQVPDAYYFGDQLLNTNQITEEEYTKKLAEAKELERKIMEK